MTTNSINKFHIRNFFFYFTKIGDKYLWSIGLPLINIVQYFFFLETTIIIFRMKMSSTSRDLLFHAVLTQYWSDSIKYTDWLMHISTFIWVRSLWLSEQAHTVLSFVSAVSIPAPHVSNQGELTTPLWNRSSRSWRSLWQGLDFCCIYTNLRWR